LFRQIWQHSTLNSFTFFFLSINPKKHVIDIC
jgi:hypothetical protein